MLTERDLQTLINYRPDNPVLSVYLNVDPTAGAGDSIKLHLRQMLKDYEQLAPLDTEAINRFIEHQYDWSGRMLAIFSCASDDFLRHYSLSVPVRSRARLMNRPYVKPFADIFDTYGHYGVVIVDQQEVRLFTFHLGELLEEKGTVGEAVRHTKRGGGSQSPGRRGGIAGQTRYAEEVAERNIKESARHASRFFQENHIRRILVGGTDENVAFFLAQLPKSWQSLVMGTFPMNMTAGHAQVLEKALNVAQQAHIEKQDRLVTAIVTAAAKGREGVIGLDDTLRAVHSGRVQTLVLSEGYRAPGFRCQTCGYLAAHSPPRCPFCGGNFERIEDAVELTVRRVFEENGEVEVIRENLQLEEVGRIGGLLRY
ncbi:MAG: hypothetical protein GTO18_15770 [Anaerolineales bacterium]|nr:hypothetical protein [Anaerolineales bacterium]